MCIVCFPLLQKTLTASARFGEEYQKNISEKRKTSKSRVERYDSGRPNLWHKAKQQCPPGNGANQCSPVQNRQQK